MSSSPNGSYHPLMSGDRPVRTLTQDRLGLSESFIPRLAKVAIEWPHSDGITIGLYGEWGIGKSSALSMLRDYVNHRRAEDHSAKYRTCRIVEFHPWFYDNPATLAAAFFATIAPEVVGTAGDVWAPVSKALRKMGKFLLVASRGVGMFSVESSLLFKAMGELTEAGSELTQLFNGGERQLTQARDEAVQGLESVGKEDGRLVVLLDDIDRLGRAEILSMLRLLRIVADLPYVTIIVAMDHDRVRTLLRSGVEAPGERYLDKFVQVPIHVPMPEPERFDPGSCTGDGRGGGVRMQNTA